MRFLRRASRAREMLDITPLVDVVFLLNIFFLLTSSYYLYSGIRIAVPQGLGDPLGSPDVVVSVTLDGRIYYQNEPRELTVNELHRKLRALKSEKPSASVLLRGDADSRFGRMIEVYSAARSAGIENLHVHTRSIVAPPSPPGRPGGGPDSRPGPEGQR